MAKRQLKLHQREHIAWERDTVWRQMIGNARRGEGADPDGLKTLGSLVIEEEKRVLDVQTPVGHIQVTMKQVYLIVSTIVFIVLLNVRSVDGDEANKCLAVLVYATLLWATEAIPLFVTSMLVPLLLVILRTIRNEDGETLSTEEATKYVTIMSSLSEVELIRNSRFVFAQMFSPTIMLLIGGFTIASALSKTGIDRLLITRVLSFAGTRPSTVLLAFMGVSCFASMWIRYVCFC